MGLQIATTQVGKDDMPYYKGNLKSMDDMSISETTGFSVQEVPCVPVGK